MFKWYKYLIVNLVFSKLVFWCGNRFLIAPSPDRCLLVPFCFLERDAHFVCEVFLLVFLFLLYLSQYILKYPYSIQTTQNSSGAFLFVPALVFKPVSQICA